MMLHHSFSLNRRSKGPKWKKAVQFTLLLAVVIWLLYQVKHSHDKKVEYSHSTENKHNTGLIELYMGCKGHPGYNDRSAARENFEHDNERVEDGGNDSAGESEGIQEGVLNKEQEESQDDFKNQDEKESGEIEQITEENNSESQPDGGDVSDDKIAVPEVEVSDATKEEALQEEHEEAQQNDVNLNKKEREQDSNEEGNTDSKTDSKDESNDKIESEETSQEAKDLSEEHQNSGESSDSSQNSADDDEKDKVTGVQEEKSIESKEEASEDSEGKDGNNSHEQNETGENVNNFHDNNGVPEDHLSSLLNETNSENQEAISSNQESSSDSISQSELSGNANLEGESDENATPGAEQIDKPTSGVEKTGDSSLAEDQTRTDTSAENEESRREAVELDGHRVSITETTSNSTLEDVQTDEKSNDDHVNSSLPSRENYIEMPTDDKNATAGTDGVHASDGETTESNPAEGEKIDAGSDDESTKSSLPSNENVTEPTDGEASERKAVESQGDDSSEAEVAANAPAEGTKLESSSGNGTDSQQVNDQDEPTEGAHAGTGQEDVASESSDSVVVSANESEELIEQRSHTQDGSEEKKKEEF